MGKTVDELMALHPDPDWRQKFIQIADLLEILADCIIADSYVVSDDLNAVLRLSDIGTKMMDRLTRREKVNAKDARLMCALTLGHEELYLDVDGIDIDALTGAISEELKGHRIRFPFVQGRTLYDAFAVMFEDEREELSNEETLRFLGTIPQGVYQYGHFTVGPYGILRSRSSRNVPASRRVAAYHCSRATCNAVHAVNLQTGYGASIHRDRIKLRNILDQTKRSASEWAAFAAEASGLAQSFFGDQRAGVLLPLVGDVFSESELRELLVHLLDTDGGELRSSLNVIKRIGRAEDFVADLKRAEMLQLLLVSTEALIGTAIDALVHSGAIRVPNGEIRRAVINHNVRSGAFGLRAELGEHGVRFVSDDTGLALLRERRLLAKLYNQGPDEDVHELEWQLRGIEVEDLDEKLEAFFRERTPREALQRLVLARRTNMRAACHEVSLEHGDSLNDEQLIDALLWKLGFRVDELSDPHRAFWQHHELLAAVAQAPGLGGSARFLEVAGPFFPKLEGILLNSLAFTAWALLADHTASSQPFSHDDSKDRTAGLALLESLLSPRLGKGKGTSNFETETVDLYNLIQSYGLLADALEKFDGERDKYQRPADEFPQFDGKTDLKTFVFRSTLPFLDLSQPSKQRILHGLREISSVLTRAEVSSVRNEYSHFRRTAPEVSRLEDALEAVRQSVSKIENLGFAPLLFRPTTTISDEWGLRRHGFAGPRSFEHVFTRPTPLDWMGLPALSEPQILMRAASFGDPNEVLRFTRRFTSAFSEIWQAFPNRRRRGSRAGTADGTTGHESEVEVSA